jgi:hypothetical protein
MSKTPLFDAALDKILSTLVPHARTCAESGKPFEITEKDVEMCKSLRVPPPTTDWIVGMRQKRSFMGGFDLYRRELPNGKSIVTMYDPESFSKFIPTEEWYSDTFDPMVYGFDARPEEPFFAQWERLARAVPRPALWYDAKSEKSDWSIYYLNVKNGYNCFGTWESEDVTYTDQTGFTKHSSDLSLCYGCEWCYDCVLCKHCASTSFSERCVAGANLLFCLGCQNCNDCFGCSNLRNKKYCFLNEQLTEEACKQKISGIDLTNNHVVEEWRERIKREIWEKAFRPGSSIINSENVEGDDIQDTHDSVGASLYSSERVYHGILEEKARDSYNTITGMNLERCVNDNASFDSYECRMTNFCIACMDVEYSEMLTSCEHCFGCHSLKHKKFCIFNKQYTEEEYWKIVDAIKAAMLVRGEYGKFFPQKVNPLAYNGSHAIAIFPMTEAEARKIGMRWYSFTEEQKGEAGPASSIPEKLADTKDEILKQAFRCPVTNRIFRIVKPELEFHREMNLALPRVHPSVRRYGRAAQQFPLYLNQRPCDSCQIIMWTRIPPSHTAPVFCQDCYEKVVIGEKELPVGA